MSELFYNPRGRINGQEIIDAKTSGILRVLGPGLASYDDFLQASDDEIEKAVGSVFEDTLRIIKQDKSLHASQVILALLAENLEDTRDTRYDIAQSLVRKHVGKLVCRLTSRTANFDNAPIVGTESCKALPNRKIALFATAGIATFGDGSYYQYPGVVYSLHTRRTDIPENDILPSRIGEVYDDPEAHLL